MYNSIMVDLSKKYEDDSEFQEFLNAEFSETAVTATLEELAEFAFGSFEEAVKAFEAYKRSDPK
jgi:hypothetical protein